MVRVFYVLVNLLKVFIQSGTRRAGFKEFGKLQQAHVVI